MGSITRSNENEHDNEDSQFGLANIPFGVVSTQTDSTPRIATRVFGKVFRLVDLIERGALGSVLEHDVELREALMQPVLNDFASLGRVKHRQVREQLQKVLDPDNAEFADVVAERAILVSEVTYHLAVKVGDFSDFSCSRDHVLNAGEAVLGVRQLPPGFLHFPVGYSGRSSSIIAPGSDVTRPLGQFRSDGGVTFGLSCAVDFELEVACVIGKPSKFGQPVGIDEADEHIFGFLLLNDWSARDIQGLEMNPLGPFNGKSFGTSVSPWIVTADALEPHRALSPRKDVPVAQYLESKSHKTHYSIQLKVEIEADGVSSTVCQSRFEWLYWTVNEMIAHQTINGCPLNAGDILATGTVSGSEPGSYGCLLETTRGGKEPIHLSSGAQRRYLEDGDAVRLTGVAGNADVADIVGFGDCCGRLRSNSFYKDAR